MTLFQRPPNFPSAGINLLLFDIDGTLRGSDGEIPPSAREELSRLRTARKLGIASGRPPYGAKAYMDQIGVNAPSILCAGGVVMQPDGTRLYSVDLEPEVTERFITECRGLGLDFELNLLDCCYVDQRTALLDIHHSYQPPGSQQVRDLLEVIRTEPVLKGSLIIDQQQFEQHYQGLCVKFPTLRFLPAHGAGHPELYFINVQNREVSITAAVEVVLAATSLSIEQLISFGDGDSDIPLMETLQWSVAMGQSNERVKRAARMVTDHVDADGLATALRALFPE